MVKKKKGSKRGADPTTSTEEYEMATYSSTTDASSTFATDTEEETSFMDNLPEINSLEKLDERSDIEKELFNLVKEGDREAVKLFINSNRPEIDVSHRDLDCNDIICCAVDLGDTRMLKLVLEINPRQAQILSGLLSAIKENKMEIVLTLLNFEDVRTGGGFIATTNKLVAASKEKKGMLKKMKKKKLEKMKTIDLIRDIDQRKYGHEVTPLMQAAKYGHYDIMQVLYDRHERLPKLHLPSCKCRECKGATRSLEASNKRIQLLEAMGTPEYMIFMASQDGEYDPILEAFHLSEILARCIDEEHAFSSKYLEIKVKVDALPASLIGLCRDTKELKIMLQQREGYTGPADNPYPRLGLAIEMAQKKFVVHPAIEFLIHDQWVEEPWNANTIQEKAVKYAFVGATMVLFPFVQILLWLAMFCCRELPTIKFLLTPVNRCLSKLMSHVVFVILLLYMNQEERAEADIEPPTIYIKWLVLVYVISHFFALLRRFLVHPSGFLKPGWNKWEIICQALFWTSFALWVYLYNRKSELGFEDYIPRTKLPKDDPLLICEILFAIASTCSSLKVMRWILLSNHVGPVQSGIARMWRITIVTLALFGLASLAFVASSHIIFRPFQNVTTLDEDTGNLKMQPMLMTDLEYVFLGLLGMNTLTYSEMELLTPNLTYINEMGEETFVMNPPETTQIYLYTFCVVFNVVVLGFLKPSMLGLFANQQEAVYGNMVEWKYLVIQEWIFNINDTYLTPPFNLLPTGFCILDSYSTLKALSSSRQRGRRRSQIQDAEGGGAGDDEDDEAESPPTDANSEEAKARRKYPFLLRDLFTRYFQEKAKLESEETAASKTDVTDVQQSLKDIKELSMELLGIHRSGSGSRRGSGNKGEPSPTLIATPISPTRNL